MLPSARFRLRLAMALLFGLSACKKEIELVPTDKVYSWREVQQLAGTQKIIVGMAADAHSIFLQQPAFFGVLSPEPTAPIRTKLSFGYYGVALANLPTDIRVQIPLNARFFATPQWGAGDSTLVLYSTTNPVNSLPPGTATAGSYIRLRQLDRQAVRYVPNEAGTFASFGAINTNDYLLLGYFTAALYRDTALHFVLTKATVHADYTLADSRTLRIPVGTSGGYIRSITAIDDYFLVDCANTGIYKIEQNGRYQLVYNSPTTIRSFYQWQGTVYGVADGNAILTSSDKGTSWQRHPDVPAYFRYSTFTAVGDSLVGITHGVATNGLYTLRWQGTTYRVRQLKSDGLGQANFTDLVHLGDTVYLGTSNGLFKKPIKTFFDSQP